MTDDIHAVLREILEGMRKSVLWLKRSHTKCCQIGVKEHYTEDEFDDFENLASRYARMLDAILNKVFRSIDAIELEDGGTLLDVVNRAEKRGIVDSAERAICDPSSGKRSMPRLSFSPSRRRSNGIAGVSRERNGHYPRDESSCSSRGRISRRARASFRICVAQAVLEWTVSIH